MCQSCVDAKEILVQSFGDKIGSDLLWSYTCFPFDGEKTLEQAKNIVKRAETKTLDEILEELDREEEEAFRRYLATKNEND